MTKLGLMVLNEGDVAHLRTLAANGTELERLQAIAHDAPDLHGMDAARAFVSGLGYMAVGRLLQACTERMLSHEEGPARIAARTSCVNVGMYAEVVALLAPPGPTVHGVSKAEGPRENGPESENAGFSNGLRQE